MRDINTMSNKEEREDRQLAEKISETDTGGRHPAGPAKWLLFGVALTWSLFQLWYASPLPFSLGIFVLNDTEARSIHLAFAIFLAYTAFPTFKSSPKDRIPRHDITIGLTAAFCAAYLLIFYEELANRPGLPTTLDLGVALCGLILLLEATRRALGPPLMIVAAIFMVYTFAGQYVPDIIAHKGASFNKGMSHYWLSTEGVFGVALGVSTSMVFMFVLFGSLLEKAGAGNYFIRVAFAMLGHLRGGPAKAAVVSSAMTGLISGSSIANVVTTGTFTIPLMKKVGFSAEKAGAVEVASSTNGQLTPPVMGAAAFLMVEYIGISYIEVIKHAFLPAIISYIALVYIVHLEACKANLQGLERKHPSSLLITLFRFSSTVTGLVVLSALVYYGLGWSKSVFGEQTPYIAGFVLLAAYLALIKLATSVPELPTGHHITEIPDTLPTVKAGLYYLLPITVLVWCLTVERLSPGLSAFWATVFMIFIVVTHKPLKAWFKKQPLSILHEGLLDLLEGLTSGARNMIGIGVATAAAGIIVGTVTLTGIGLIMTEFVEFISGGNLLLILLFTAIISLLLGMGLPTTANYIVVSTLMAPVIVTLGAENGLIVPLVAVHLFVFYFGILADDTPPVGLAAFAAAAISGGDPIRTGIQGFTYDIRTAILPFLFIFNTEILLIGVTSLPHLLLVIVSCIIAMLAFAAATQGFFLTHNRKWESVALLLVAFTIFRPGYFWDEVYPPLKDLHAAQVYNVIDSKPEKSLLRLAVSGETLEGNQVNKVVVLTLPPGDGAVKRLADAGLELEQQDKQMIVSNVEFGSEAEKAGIDFDWQIDSLQVENQRPPRQLMYLPALLLLMLVWFNQKKRAV